MPDAGVAPKVTVIMIFLNAARYFAEAIDSVLAQTYRDFELVLVDDGSTDDSTRMAKDYAARHPEFVRYTEHDAHRNLGMSASRNHGARIGRGRLISFLDSDDVWLPTRLERFVGEIDQHPSVGMLYGPTLYWYSWATPGVSANEGQAQEDFPGSLGLPTNRLIEPPVPLLKWLETEGGALPGICSLLIRREAFEAVGGFDPEFRGLYEDQVFLSKIALHHAVVVIDDVLDYYRQHPDSHCHRSIETGDYHPVSLHPARQRYLLWLEAYFRQHEVKHPTLLRALKRELWPYRSAVNAAVFNTRRNLPIQVRAAYRRYVPSQVRSRLRAWHYALERRLAARRSV